MRDAATLSRAIEAKAESLRDALMAKVVANLSGDILQTRSGTLKASIVADLVVDATSVFASVASVGVPYAAIQERGGITPPHDIVPVKAQALAFSGAGGMVFARRVHHPGSKIPARAPLGHALDSLRDDILGGLKGAVLDALGAS